MYQESLKFFLQFCCMNLIAATRAEGGLKGHTKLPGYSVGMSGWGGGCQCQCLIEAHIPNLSLLLCQDAWWCWCWWQLRSRPVLGFIWSQAGQYCKTLQYSISMFQSTVQIVRIFVESFIIRRKQWRKNFTSCVAYWYVTTKHHHLHHYPQS